MTPEEQTKLDLALVECAGKGDIDEARRLLKEGASPDARNLSWTALHQALYHGRGEVASLLIQQGASITEEGPNGASVLHYSARSGLSDLCRDFVRAGISPNVRDKTGTTPMGLAAEQGQIGTFKGLQAMGADPFLADKNDYSPLHLAAYHGRWQICELITEAAHAKVLTDKEKKSKKVLKTPAERIDLPNKNTGQSALHIAANMGKEATTKVLLMANASVHVLDKTGYAPMHLAANGGNATVIEMLAGFGAPVDDFGNGGYLPIHLACSKGHEDAFDEFLKLGASPHDPTRSGRESPLHLASGNGNVGIARKLMDLGADVNATNARQETPLIKAASGAMGSGSMPEDKRIRMCRDLIERGADLDARDFEGKTALYHAASKDAREICMMLLQAGADPSIKSDAGVSAQSAASRKGHKGLSTQINAVERSMQAASAIEGVLAQARSNP
jgi:ankyrin repeat protein